MHQSSSISVQNNHKMKIIFSDPTFSLQLLRAMGETYNRGADIGVYLPHIVSKREILKAGIQNG